MFDLPALSDDPLVPIPTFVAAKDLRSFLVIVEDRKYHPKLYSEGNELAGPPSRVTRLPLVDKVALQELADRFDCESISNTVKRILAAYYSARTALKLLEEASQVESLTVAREAIKRLGTDHEVWSGALYSKWWHTIKGLRFNWQVELTSLVWENQYELVNRPGQQRKILPSGRYAARKREAIMVKTTRSWQDIADAFNPNVEVSQYHRGYSSTDRQSK